MYLLSPSFQHTHMWCYCGKSSKRIQSAGSFILEGKGALVLCSCRGSGTSGGLGFLPVSLCPCGVSIPSSSFFSLLLPYLLYVSPTGTITRLLLRTAWKDEFCAVSASRVPHSVTRQRATRGRGRADTGDAKTKVEGNMGNVENGST